VTPPLLVLIGLALFFSLLNGYRDSSNIVATMISSRAFRPAVALAVTAAAEFSGPLIFGVAVATTIGKDLVVPSTINLPVIVVALATACLWSLFTWVLHIPSSSSHALIGGLVGAAVVGAGWQAIQVAGLLKVLVALLVAPLVGLTVGFLLTKLVFYLAQGATPRINRFFKQSQLVTAVALAFSHGTNDGQKSMGIITLGLVTAGRLSSFAVPLWVIVACSGMLALGTALGDWGLIKTVGAKFYKIRPVDGFSAQLASAIVILSASLLGGPVSTTQVVSSAIVGAGSAERLSRVRWGVAGDILLTWVLTIPATALVAAGIYWAVTQAAPAVIKLVP
jgi:PiT family inorganic phosphate transporter